VSLQHYSALGIDVVLVIWRYKSLILASNQLVLDKKYARTLIDKHENII